MCLKLALNLVWKLVLNKLQCELIVSIYIYIETKSTTERHRTINIIIKLNKVEWP